MNGKTKKKLFNDDKPQTVRVLLIAWEVSTRNC